MNFVMKSIDIFIIHYMILL